MPVLALGAAHLAALARRVPGLRRRVEKLADALAPLQSVNSYGPFSVMTRTRPEVVVEGSDDGVTWQEYGFRYKMGDLARAPRWVAPHMPRLDWQMWFAALAGVPRWFLGFLARLLQGSPDVLALLAHNPFPERPPRYVRAGLYDYKIVSAAEHAASGAYWQRERVGSYVPAVRLG
jgi:hypothetical protein